METVFELVEAEPRSAHRSADQDKRLPRRLHRLRMPLDRKLRTDQPEQRTCTRTRWHQQARAWAQTPRNPEL